jgi:hypothetical protein
MENALQLLYFSLVFLTTSYWFRRYQVLTIVKDLRNYHWYLIENQSV